MGEIADSAGQNIVLLSFADHSFVINFGVLDLLPLVYFLSMLTRCGLQFCK